MRKTGFFFLAAVTLAPVLGVGSGIARAEVVVVVSSKSSVGALTREQVRNIFLGLSPRFPSGEQAIPIDLAQESAQFDKFHNSVTGKNVSTLRAHWSRLVFSGRAKPPREIPNQNEALKLVANNPNMIGYIDKALVDTTVRIVFP